MAELALALQNHDLGDEQLGAKRKRDDNSGTPQQRAKRNRYISIACNECKRRKIKCNGESPCHRCGNLNLECLYAPNCCSSNFKDSTEYKDLTTQVQALQAQVEGLVQNLNTLRSSLGQDVYIPEDGFYNSNGASRSMSAPDASMVIDPALQGRSRQGRRETDQDAGIGRQGMPNMGMHEVEDGLDDRGPDRSRGVSPFGAMSRGALVGEKDPIWLLSRDEAVRLVKLYDEEMGLLYPILSVERVIRHAALLYTFIDAMSRNAFLKHLPGADNISDEETDVLKLVLAIAMTVQGTGRSDLAMRLVKSVSTTADNKLLGNVTLKDVQILTLIAIYHFHTDDEGLSWRVIGLAARLCIELGLHRSETYDRMFNNEEDRVAAIKLFWSVYTLDRRWSFGTGMSFALQDADIDALLPRPNESSPYLTAMIEYSSIASTISKSINAAEADSKASKNDNEPTLSEEEVDFLDFQVMQWHRSLPDILHYNPSTQDGAQHSSNPATPSSRAFTRQRVVLYLRANQMRISIYRPFLQSPGNIHTSTGRAMVETVTNIAKDTIHVLKQVNQASEIYRNHVTTFDYFLLAALAVLCLALGNSAAAFAESCRKEFYMALELVRDLSPPSYVTRRLWRMIRGIRELGLRRMFSAASNGIASPAGDSANGGHASRPNHHDAHSAAALTMVGLTGKNNMDERSGGFFSTQGFSNVTGNGITNGNHIGLGMGKGSGMGGGPGGTRGAAPALGSSSKSNNNATGLDPDLAEPSPEEMATELASFFKVVESGIVENLVLDGADVGMGIGFEDGGPMVMVGGAGGGGGKGVRYRNKDELSRVLRHLF